MVRFSILLCLLVSTPMSALPAQQVTNPGKGGPRGQEESGRYEVGLALISAAEMSTSHFVIGFTYPGATFTEGVRGRAAALTLLVPTLVSGDVLLLSSWVDGDPSLLDVVMVGQFVVANPDAPDGLSRSRDMRFDLGAGTVR